MKFPGKLAALAGMLLPGAFCIGSVAAQHGTPATPPPCVAEGCCYPSYPWGLTKTKWRKFPTAGMPAMQPGPSGAMENPLGGFQAPPPAEEDREAPPMIEALEPAAPMEGGAGGVELPPLPELEQPTPETNPPREPEVEGLPFGNPLPRTNPPANPGANPGGGLDLPPSLPFGTPPANPPAGGTPPAPTPEPFQFNRRQPPVEQDYGPPGVPPMLGNAAARATAPAMVSTPATVRRLPAIPAPIVEQGQQRQNVQQASSQQNNMPPALPAIFFGE